MKKRFFFMTLACFLLSACSCGGISPSSSSSDLSAFPPSDSETEEKVDYATYQSYWMKQHDYKTMPVCAFIAPPVKVGEYTENFVTEEQYRVLAESGINTAYGLTESLPMYASDVQNALSYCDKFGLSYVACVSGLHTMRSGSQVENAVYNPLLLSSPAALGGVIIRDEPSSSEFEGCKKAKELISGFLPEILYHGNLFPDYATQAQLYNRGTGTPALPENGYSYEQYLDDYIRTFSPQILSYDYYPMEKKAENIKSGYFENMSVIREKAAAAKIPFWVYIQTCSFNSSVRIPNEGEIQWLVNTSLAYGSKGIQYFTYFLPNDSNEIFHGAMIDRQGNKTPIYDYVKRVNGQIKAVDEVLMCALSKGVIVTGDTPCAVPEKDKISSYGALEKISASHLLTGCFDYRGKDAYYAVNNSITEAENAVFTLTGKRGFYVVDGQRKPFENTIAVNLEKGRGILIVTE